MPACRHSGTARYQSCKSSLGTPTVSLTSTCVEQRFGTTGRSAGKRSPRPGLQHNALSKYAQTNAPTGEYLKFWLSDLCRSVTFCSTAHQGVAGIEQRCILALSANDVFW